MQVTPLQLARATATLANRGEVVAPHLVNTEVDGEKLVMKDAEQINLNQNNVSEIMAAMINVIHGPRGTARRLKKGIDYQIAGKTGTAQVFTVKQDEKYNENKITKKLKDHALFISFAPADAPQIAVAVIVENGGHGGSVAAPIAGKIMKQFITGVIEHKVEEDLGEN
jgi:penicillin-binding protein 2